MTCVNIVATRHLGTHWTYCDHAHSGRISSNEHWAASSLPDIKPLMPAEALEVPAEAVSYRAGTAWKKASGRAGDGTMAEVHQGVTRRPGV